jgi:hypothetical protein
LHSSGLCPGDDALGMVSLVLTNALLLLLLLLLLHLLIFILCQTYNLPFLL